jgi:hypothetical protein
VQAWLKAGLSAGAAFSAVGIAFVLLSLFTEISRPMWMVLDNVKSVIGFGFCGIAGFLAGRQTHRATSGARAGAVGGMIAGITVPVSIYVLAYGFVEAVRQYPFEYYDYLSSGAPSVQAFLLSPDGNATVRGTSLGLVPVAVVWAATLGAAVGYLGGRMGTRRPGTAAAAARPNTPLQPASGEQIGVR